VVSFDEIIAQAEANPEAFAHVNDESIPVDTGAGANDVDVRSKEGLSTTANSLRTG
jgi:hypothetical protein